MSDQLTELRFANGRIERTPRSLFVSHLDKMSLVLILAARRHGIRHVSLRDWHVGVRINSSFGLDITPLTFSTFNSWACIGPSWHPCVSKILCVRWVYWGSCWHWELKVHLGGKFVPPRSIVRCKMLSYQCGGWWSLCVQWVCWVSWAGIEYQRYSLVNTVFLLGPLKSRDCTCQCGACGM